MEENNTTASYPYASCSDVAQDNSCHQVNADESLRENNNASSLKQEEELRLPENQKHFPAAFPLDLYKDGNLVSLLESALTSSHEVMNPLRQSAEYSNLLESLRPLKEYSQADFTDEKYLQCFWNTRNALLNLTNSIKTRSLQNVDLKFFEIASNLFILPLVRHETENVFLQVRRRVEDNIQDLYGSSTHKAMFKISIGFPFNINISIAPERHQECFTNLRCFFTNIDAIKGSLKGSLGILNNAFDVGLKLAIAKAKVTLFYSLESYLDFLNQRHPWLHFAMLKTQNTSLRNTDDYRIELQELEKENLLDSSYFESRLHILGALPWDTRLKLIDVTEATSTENIDEITETAAVEADAGLRINDGTSLINFGSNIRVSRTLKKYKKKTSILALLNDDLSLKEDFAMMKQNLKAIMDKNNDKLKNDFLSLTLDNANPPNGEKIINILHVFSKQLQGFVSAVTEIITAEYAKKQTKKRLEEAKDIAKQAQKCLKKTTKTMKLFPQVPNRLSAMVKCITDGVKQKLTSQRPEDTQELPMPDSPEQERIDQMKNRKETETERWQNAKNAITKLEEHLKFLQKNKKNDIKKLWKSFFCADMGITSLKSACMMGYLFREKLVEKIPDTDNRRAEGLRLLKRIRSYLEKLEKLCLLREASVDKKDNVIPKNAIAKIWEAEAVGNVQAKNQVIEFSSIYRSVKDSPILTENGKYIIIRFTAPVALSGQFGRRFLETNSFKSLLSYLDKEDGEREPTDQEGTSAKIKDYARVICSDVGNIISSQATEALTGGMVSGGIGAASDHEWILKILEAPKIESQRALPFVNKLIPFRRRIVIDYMLSTGKSIAKASFATPTLWLPVPSFGISTSNASGKVEKRTGSDTLHDMFAKYNSMSLGAVDTNTPITSINLLFANQSHQLLKMFRSIGEKNMQSNALFELQEVYNELLRLNGIDEQEITRLFERFIEKCIEIAPLAGEYENGTKEKRNRLASEIGVKNNQGRLAYLCRSFIDICEKQYVHIFKPHYDKAFQYAGDTNSAVHEREMTQLTGAFSNRY
ncbi:MAG: hypothetical protein LBT70_01525 [Holosporaceae bacterium]|nr:hypothetical protein [Holosporaceae bacterium]